MSSLYIPGLTDFRPAACAISSKIAAIIIHEAIGHLAEGDFALACAHQSPFLCLPSVSEKITIVDYAHTAFGKPCPIQIFTDDEGTTAKDVCIIKKGQRDSLMTNLHTAVALNLPLTGNARASSSEEEPMVRMRNTALLPGGDTPSEIISSIRSGYYLTEPGNCYGDINGDFCVEIKEGYNILFGQVIEKIPPCMAFCNAADFLKSISMVANDFEWHLDDCSKWYQIKVAQGAPTIKARLEIGVM